MLAKSPHLTVRDSQAAIIPSAQIEVFAAGTTNPAQVFSDSDGQSALTQPFSVTSKAVIEFYAEGGNYDIKITADGSETVLSDVRIGTAQGKDAPEEPGDLLLSVYEESPTEPSSENVIWHQKFDGERQLFKVAPQDSEFSEYSTYDYLMFDQISQSQSGLQGFKILNQSPIFVVGTKLLFKGQRLSDTTDGIVACDIDFSNPELISTATTPFNRTDRGVCFLDTSSGSQPYILNFVTDSLTPVESVGQCPDLDYVSQSGLSAVGYVSGAGALQVYDISGADAAPTAGIQLSDINADSIDTSALTTDGNVCIFKAQMSDFSNQIFYIDATGVETGATLISDTISGFRTFALEGYAFYQDTSDGQAKITDTVTTISLGTDGPDGLFAVSGTELTLLLETPSNEHTLQKIDFSTEAVISSGAWSDAITNANDGFVYAAEGADGKLYIFDLENNQFSSQTESFGTNQFQSIAFYMGVNPIESVYVKLSGNWVEFKNNKASYGVVSIPNLGQDLNALNQNHAANADNVVFLSTGESSDGYSGANSVAIGHATYGSSPNSVVLGDNSSAGGDNSGMVENQISIGSYAYSYNKGSIAIGESSYAEHYDTEAQSGSGPIAFGHSSYASGIEVTLFGNNTNGGGIGSTGVGFGASISSDYGSALGNGATVDHIESVALGHSTATSEDNSVAVGDRNLDIQGNGRGLIMRSPDGTVHDVTVDNAGTLQVVARSGA